MLHAYQRDDNLAIRCRLEVVGLLEMFPDATVVVDLTVDGKDDRLVGVGQRLGTRL